MIIVESGNQEFQVAFRQRKVHKSGALGYLQNTCMSVPGVILLILQMHLGMILKLNQTPNLQNLTNELWNFMLLKTSIDRACKMYKSLGIFTSFLTYVSNFACHVLQV